MIARPSSFDDVFDNQVITDCDISIRYQSGLSTFVEILNKKNIRNFKCKSHNSYLCEEYPSEEITFDILNWESLSSTIKTLLTTKGQSLFFHFIAGGITTTGGKCGIIQSCKVDFDKYKATIKCVSYLASSLFSKGMDIDTTSQTMSYTLRDTISSLVFNNIYFINSVQLSSYSIDNDFTDYANLQYEITRGQLLQNIITSSGGGFNLNFNGTTFNATIKTFANAKLLGNIVDFSEINIGDDVDVDTEDVKTSTIVGYNMSGSTTDIVKTATTTLSTASYTLIIQDVDTKYLINMVRIANTSLSTTLVSRSGTTISALFFGQNPISAGTYNVNLYGTTYTPPAYYQGSGTEITIQTHNLKDTNTTQKTKVKTDADLVLSYNKKISFSCRLNPAIEPLDVIRFGGVGVVSVEDVETNFNGSFTGKVSGRFLAEWVKKPLLVELDIADPDNFTIEIDNENDFECTAIIFYSQGLSSTFTIPANSYLILNNGNANELWQSINEKNNGTLMDEVGCYFINTNNSLGISDNLILIEGD